MDTAVNLADRSYFQNALTTRTFAIGEYQFGRITQKATVNLAQPSMDEQGNLRAVVYAALDLAWLYNLMTNANLPPGSSMTVMDHNRVTLARYPDPEGKYVGRAIATAASTRTPQEEAARPRERVRIWPKP